MKFNNLYIILILTLFVKINSINGQKGVVRLSEEYKLKEGVFKGHLKTDDNFHYLLFAEGMGKVTYTIKKFDSNFKEISSKELKVDKEDVFGTAPFLTKDRLGLLLGALNKKDENISYSVVPLSYDGTPQPEVNIGKFVATKRNRPFTYFKLSADSSKMVLAITNNERDDLPRNFFVQVLDNNFNKLWSNKFMIKTSVEKSKILSTVVSDEGVVYFLCKEKDADTRKDSKRVNGKKVSTNKLILYKFVKDVNKPVRIEIDIDDTFLKGGELAFDKKGNLFFVGFWSKILNGATHGLFIMGIDREGNKLVANKREFSSSNIEKMSINDDNKTVEKGDEGLDAKFVFKKILFNEDGSLDIVAEENYMYSVQHKYYVSYHYVSKDILIFKVNEKGELAKTNLIPKNQNYPIQDVSSFTLLDNSSGSYFIYNENEDNFKTNINSQTKSYKSTNIKNCIPALTVLDVNNKLSRTELMGKDADIKFVLYPTYCSVIDDTNIFICLRQVGMYQKSNFQFGILTITK